MANISADKKTPIFRFIWVSAWYAFAAIAVLLATLFAAARLLLPYADQYNAELGERLSSYLNQPVLVRSLDAEWHGWGPSLVLRDATLLDSMGEHPVLQLEKIRLGLNLFSSVRQWQPVFSNITLVGVDLQLMRSVRGNFSVEGISTQKDGGKEQREDTELVMQWLFSQGQLGLENSNITWRDEMNGDRLMRFSSVTVTLRNDGNRHQLDASLDLPRNLGKSLELRVDMVGNPLQSEGRRTQLFLAGEHVHLTELFDKQSFADVDFSVKSASFQVWAKWNNGELRAIKGNVDAGDLVMASTNASVEKKVLALNRVSTDFNWQVVANGWRLDGNELLLARQSRQWEPSRVSLKFEDSPEEGGKLDAFSSFLQLEDISQILSLFSVGGDVVQQPLFAINPHGVVRDAHVNWQSGDAHRYQAYARLRNASVNAWRAVPAAKNVDGALWLDSESGVGQVALQYATVTLDFPELFRWPLEVEELRGSVAWQQDQKGWRVVGRNLEASNEDVGASATLDIIKNNVSQSPFMSLLVNFHDGNGSQVARYLPTGIMSEAAVDWLDEAIVSAEVVTGGSIFHGRLNNFPFDDGDGRFEVNFAVKNANLNYAKSWPPITGAAADIIFSGRGMYAKVSEGKILSNDIRWANVQIADMTTVPIMLGVKGEVQGITQDKLDYLVTSPPLYTAFAQHLEGMSAKGESLLNLDLRLPIGNSDPVKVNGWLSMKENTLSIPSLGSVLSELEGRLDFSQDGLHAENLQSELFGQETQINITTDAPGSAHSKIRARAQGMFDAADLAARYLPPVKELLVGDGEWNISFDIPMGNSDSSTSQVAVLQARSNLKGIEARLPPPFDKAADEAGNMELRVDFPPRQLPILRINYAGFVDGVFALGDLSPDTALAEADVLNNSFRGEVRLNGGAAQLPEHVGLRLTGWLDVTSFDDWRNLRLEDATASDHQASLFNSADIALRELEAYGQKMHNVRFKLATLAEGLQADIDSKELKGRIVVPTNLQSEVLQADIDYWHLAEMNGGANALDPRDIPALDFTIGDFRYKKSQFGSVRLETANVADGLRIEQLVVKPRSTTITARGGWYVRGDTQSSNMQLHVESQNIGHTLRALDYIGGIDKGKGKADLVLHWPGSFADVDAKLIQGKLNMSLKDGYLLDVDPGAGRMFGMLSIQTLPRRLLLDFSDVFKKGFGFDRLKGTFSIEDGDAYTNNLYMKGPAARVDITGRTGLAAQDYDQLVTVTPHVSESLPVIGALAATPQVGAVVLAIQKLFKPAIDEATQTHYTITGSWNEPVIKKVKSVKQPVDTTDDEEP